MSSRPDMTGADWIIAVLEQSREFALMRLAPDGVIVGWHGAAERIFGYSAADAEGRHFHMLFVEEDRALGVPEHELELARRTGRSEDDRWHQRADGSRFWASGILGAYRDAAGDLVGYVKVLRDRTDLRMRLELLQSRVDTLAGELEQRGAAHLTLLHELRNSVGPLASAAQLLQQDLPPDARCQMADIIQRQTRVLRRLLDDAAVDDPCDAPRSFRRVVLQDALRAVVEGFRAEAARRQIVLQLIPTAGDIELEADPDALQQMLLNLVSNAIKYSCPCGHVSVSATVEGAMALIRVEDDGIGIAPESVERIFELFTREPAGAHEPSVPGSGIGLAVVRRLASQHGGFVEVRSPGRGKGSVFFLTLPLRQFRND